MVVIVEQFFTLTYVLFRIHSDLMLTVDQHYFCTAEKRQTFNNLRLPFSEMCIFFLMRVTTQSALRRDEYLQFAAFNGRHDEQVEKGDVLAIWLI